MSEAIDNVGTLPAIDAPTSWVGDTTIPMFYQDEEDPEVGDSTVHTESCAILYFGIRTHLSARPEYRVYCNLDLHYSPTDPRAFAAPDVMAMRPLPTTPRDLPSYFVGRDGPGPGFVGEVLSPRTARDRDLAAKPVLYAQLGVSEYLLVDVTGVYLPERLLLKRLQPDGSWLDVPDSGGGVTSQLGFRVIIDTDGQIRVLDAATGKSYPRPEEAEAEAEARRKAEEKIRELEAELQRLRQQLSVGDQKGSSSS